MRKLASFRIESVNPELITIEQPTSPSPSPTQHLRSRSVCSPAANKSSIVNWNLFGQPGSSTRLPRNMLPWDVVPSPASASASSIAAATESDNDGNDMLQVGHLHSLGN